MRLAGQQRDWEELADLDPYWAIASAPDKRFGGWGAEELMATGRAPIARLMRRAEELGRPRAEAPLSTSAVASGGSRGPWRSISRSAWA